MLFGFGKKKETPEEKAERLRKAYEGMQREISGGVDKYNKLCQEVGEVLASAGKPSRCNTVRFATMPYLFPKLKSYQVFTDWEIWRKDDTLYVYCPAVEDYPESYYDGDAPAIAKIEVSDIVHFKIEGGVYSETKVSGGRVKQDRYTGKITQEAIRSKTVQHDDRVVRMSVMVDGIVEQLDFEYPAFDVFCALIPEKER